jgi:hypothetical protein
MAIIQSGLSGTTLMTVDPTYTAGRITQRPIEQLGSYSVSLFTGAYTTAAANSTMFSMRFVAGSAGQAQIALIQRIALVIVPTTAFTAAQQVSYGAYVARSFSAVDSGGTAATLTGNNNKLRTSMSTTQISATGDMRISTTGALTAGTRTLDSQAFAVASAWVPTALVAQPIQQVILYENFAGDQPLVLATQEGIVINNLILMGAAGVLSIGVTIEWTESSTTATTSF